MVRTAKIKIAKSLERSVDPSQRHHRLKLKESVKARVRATVRRLLAKYDYPPDLEEKSVEPVLVQAELFATESA